MATVLPNLQAVSALPGPRGWPLVGNLLQINLESFHQSLEGWAKEFGPLYRIQLGPRSIVVISDADTIKRMHRERPDTFRRTTRLADAIEEMGFAGVFSAEGDNWRRQRKLVAMALNTAHLKPFFPKLQAITARLLRRVGNAPQQAERRSISVATSCVSRSM